MSRIKDLSPSPKSHIKTLMRIGYSMSSAIADILDNSISAKSKKIEIFAPPGLENPLISIIDDGHGMDLTELIENMRIGCKDPNIAREQGDLGRFGSGMKTASFSQARRLTVITKKIGFPIAAAVWDIDNIEKTDSWCLEILEYNEIKDLSYLKIDSNTQHGTQLIWEKLSCIQIGSHAGDSSTELASRLSEVEDYISLHFHRFMEGKNKRSFLINNREIQPIDPFMVGADGYQEGRSEKLRCKGGYVVIKTHVLPHFNRMDPTRMRRLGGNSGITQNQGLYIYREGRLINAGSWLGLAKNSQLGALARVQIDVPSAIDHEWSTDVKKSSLQLPPRIKRELKKFLNDPIKRSKNTYTYRGKADIANSFWKITENENTGIITYHFDPQNPSLIQTLASCDRNISGAFVRYLTELSQSLPINHIYQKMSESPTDIDQDIIDRGKIDSVMNAAMEELRNKNTDG